MEFDNYNLRETFSWYTLYVDYFSFNNGGCELFPYIFKYSKDILMNGWIELFFLNIVNFSNMEPKTTPSLISKEGY